MSRTASAIAIAALLASAPAFAEDAHHPPGVVPAAQAQTAPQAQPQPGPGMPMGGPGGGAMMGGPMMGDGQAGMCPMMGGMGSQMMGDMSSHIEGHLAFLKAELKIKPVQEKEWTAFADALRASATAMAGMQGMMTGGTTQSVAQSLEQKERLLVTRLDNTKRLRAAWGKLDAVLSPEQRKTADQVVGPRLLMM